jgi:hypothetical protein
MYYAPILMLHVLLSAGAGFGAWIVGTSGWTTEAIAGGTVTGLAVAGLLIMIGCWLPPRIKKIFERERVIWEHVLRAPFVFGGEGPG